MKIRVMTISDYDKVYSLWKKTEGMGLNEIDDSREGIAKFLSRNPDTCFVAEDDDKDNDDEKKIIGVIMAGSDGKRAYIYHTAVSKDFRGKGIGKALVEKCLEKLTEMKIHKVALLCFKTNEEGNSFWEKQGFLLRSDINYRNKTLDLCYNH